MAAWVHYSCSSWSSLYLSGFDLKVCWTLQPLTLAVPFSPQGSGNSLLAKSDSLLATTTGESRGNAQEGQHSLPAVAVLLSPLRSQGSSDPWEEVALPAALQVTLELHLLLPCCGNDTTADPVACHDVLTVQDRAWGALWGHRQWQHWWQAGWSPLCCIRCPGAGADAMGSLGFALTAALHWCIHSTFLLLCFDLD